MTSRLMIILAMIIGLTACNDDLPISEETSVNLNFKLEYDNSPLVMFEEVNYPDGRKMRFSRISGYLSEISLLQDTASTEIKDAVYMVLSDSHNDLETAQNGYDLTLNTTDVDNYNALSFNIGLTPAQNSTTPNEYLSDNDLSKVSEYWPGWESYVFFKLEGNIDLDDNGTFDAGESFALHMGSDAAMRSKMINIDKQEGYEFVIAIDEVFKNTDGFYDIDGQRQIHSLTETAIDNINNLADNLINAITIK